MRTLVAAFLLIYAAGVTGCSNTKTSWEAGGDYYATLTIADTTSSFHGIVHLTEGIQVDHEVRMCDVRNVTWGLPFSSVTRDQVAAIRITLPRALCHEDSDIVSGGTVLTMQPVASDTSVLLAQPASGWTITGTVTVAEYTDFNAGEPAVNERVLSETAKGTFALEAHGPNGEVVRFQNGTYQFDIYVRKDPYDPFD